MSTNPIDKKYIMNIVHICIMFFFMFLFKNIPPFLSITDAGMEILGLFLGMVYGWCTLGMIYPGLMILVAVVFTDYFTLSSFIAAGVGTTTFTLVVGCILFSYVITCTNMSEVIVAKMFRLKIINSTSWGLFAIIALCGFILSITTNGLVAVLILSPMLLQIASASGYDKDSNTTTIMMMLMLVGAVLGGIALPFKDNGLLTTAAFSAMLPNYSVNVGQYMLYIIIMSLLCISAMILFVKFVLKVDTSGFSNYQVDMSKPSTFNTEQKIALSFFVIFIVGFLMPTFLPNCALKVILTEMGGTGIAALLIIIMSLLKINGKPLYDFRAAAKNMSWDAIMCTLTCLPVVMNLANDAMGIRASLVTIFYPLFSELSPIVFVALIVATTMLLTNFFNNIPCCIIFSAIALSFAPTMGIDYLPVCMLLIMTTNMSFATPAAATLTTLLFSSGNVNTSKLMKYGFLALIPSFVILLAIGYPLACLIF